MTKVPLRIKIALITVIILWASAFICIRVGLDSYSPGPLALLRYLIASVCMLFFYFSIKKRSKLNLSETLRAILCGVLGFGVYNLALNQGEITTNVSIASFIISQVPLVTIILSTIFLKERLTRSKIIGLAISVTGIIIILLSQFNGLQFNSGMIYIAIATIAAGLYCVIQKPLLNKISAIEFTSIAIWAGTASMLVFLPQLIEQIKHAPIYITIDVLYMGIFPAAIAYYLLSYALSKVEVSYAVFYLYWIPLVTVAMGYVFLKESIPLLGLIGGIIAILGVFYSNYKKAV